MAFEILMMPFSGGVQKLRAELGVENVSAGETDLVKRKNERQMMKLKILFLGFPAYTCIALFHISCHCYK